MGRKSAGLVKGPVGVALARRSRHAKALQGLSDGVGRLVFHAAEIFEEGANFTVPQPGEQPVGVRKADGVSPWGEHVEVNRAALHVNPFPCPARSAIRPMRRFPASNPAFLVLDGKHGLGKAKQGVRDGVNRCWRHPWRVAFNPCREVAKVGGGCVGEPCGEKLTTRRNDGRGVGRSQQKLRCSPVPFAEEHFKQERLKARCTVTRGIQASGLRKVGQAGPLQGPTLAPGPGLPLPLTRQAAPRFPESAA